MLGEAGKQYFYNKCFENSRSQIVFRTDILPKIVVGCSCYRPKRTRMEVIVRELALYFAADNNVSLRQAQNCREDPKTTRPQFASL